MNAKKNPLHTVSLRLDSSELAALQARAKSSGRSLGAVAKAALLAHLIESSQLDRFELFSTQLAASASEAMRASARDVEDDTRAVIEQMSAIAVQQAGALDSLMARLDGLMAAPSTVSPSRPAPPSTRWTPGKEVPD
ncbi:ribbon-helix-helix protein, CopG family [Bacillus sp. NP157]|nr:ribbon-helix-helix protein, CopG family [Bacillus sp. NP157]